MPRRPWCTLIALVLAGATQAQTPEQLRQMEYERQQREYWRAQEAQRIEEARRRNEEIRLQQEREAAARREKDNADSARRRDEQWEQDSKAARARQQQSLQDPQAQGAQWEAARQSWLKKPPLPKERNALLGRWTRPEGARATTNDPFMMIMQAAKSGLCDMFFSDGTYEFRPTSLVNIDARGRVEELDQVEYRGEGKLVAVIPKTTFKLLLFELDGPDRASWTIEGKNCTLHRVGAAGRGATAAAPSPAPTSAPSAVPAAANAPAAASSSAVISLAAAIGSIADGRPLANSAVFILRHDAETALRQGGVQARPGMTVLQTWAAECQQRTPLCQKGVQGLQAAGIGILRTDAQGRGQTPSLPPGTYYVVASYREAGLERFWNLRVDVKPGLNNVTLDRRNMVTP